MVPHLIFIKRRWVSAWALVALSAGVGACTLPDIAYDGSTRSTLIYEAGSRNFAVFVHPRTAPKQVAIDAALDKAHPHCSNNFGSTKVEIASLRDGSFAVPMEWEVTGRCL